jgi:hypothetical protein
MVIDQARRAAQGKITPKERARLRKLQAARRFARKHQRRAHKSTKD